MDSIEKMNSNLKQIFSIQNPHKYDYIFFFLLTLNLFLLANVRIEIFQSDVCCGASYGKSPGLRFLNGFTLNDIGFMLTFHLKMNKVHMNINIVAFAIRTFYKSRYLTMEFLPKFTALNLAAVTKEFSYQHMLHTRSLCYMYFVDRIEKERRF